MSALEQSSTGDNAQNLRLVYISAAEEVQYTLSSGDVSKYILLRIPFRSLAFFRKVSNLVIDKFEEKFNWPVFVCADRKIISRRGKYY